MINWIKKHFYVLGILLIAVFLFIPNISTPCYSQTTPPPTPSTTPSTTPSSRTVIYDSSLDSCWYAKDPPTFMNMLGSTLDVVISWIVGIIGLLLKWLLNLIVTAFLITLGPGTWQGFVDNKIVQQIWPLVRNFANIVLALGMIIIAVATIIREKKYNYQAILGKLIIAALLVNFSLVICGMLVDISNYLTLYFLNAGNTTTLNTAITTTLDSIACIFVGASIQSGFPFPQTAGTLLSLMICIIFLGQFIALIVYTVTRVLKLWLCLIASPLAFVIGIFPFGTKLFNTWRNTFTEALVNIPILSFSIWMILVFMHEMLELLLPIAKGKTEASMVMVIIYGMILVILAQALIIIAHGLKLSTIENTYNSVTKGITGLMGAGATAVGKASVNKAVRSDTWNKVATWGASSKFKAIRNMATPMMQASKAAQTKQEEKIKSDLTNRGATGNATQLRTILNDLYRSPRHNSFEWNANVMETLSQLTDASKGKDLLPQDREAYVRLKKQFPNDPRIKSIETIMPSWKIMQADFVNGLLPAEQNEIALEVRHAIQVNSTTLDRAGKIDWYAFVKDLEDRHLAGQAKPVGFEAFGIAFGSMNDAQLGYIINSVKPNRKRALWDMMDRLYEEERPGQHIRVPPAAIFHFINP
ncbi:MAG: hypothetical protein NTW73_01770 [Candidatus Parcubacteria bacterium]|nr:hypothetical protein [Candidatus Parcubacteria bacterium]